MATTDWKVRNSVTGFMLAQFNRVADAEAFCSQRITTQVQYRTGPIVLRHGEMPTLTPTMRVAAMIERQQAFVEAGNERRRQRHLNAEHNAKRIRIRASRSFTT
jgi:hypothetical protein